MQIFGYNIYLDHFSPDVQEESLKPLFAFDCWTYNILENLITMSEAFAQAGESEGRIGRFRAAAAIVRKGPKRRRKGLYVQVWLLRHQFQVEFEKVDVV